MSFFNNIVNAVSDNLISGGAYFQIAKGIAVTAIITLVAWIVAFVLGTFLSYLTCYEKKLVSGIGRALCFINRSVPVIIAIWFVYYCFAGGSLASILCVAVGIGLYGAGSMSEIITRAARKEMSQYSERVRDSLEKVHFSTVVPQAFENSLFELKRLALLLMAFSSLAGYVGVGDLTQVMSAIGHRTMYPFFSLFFCAICYMIAAGIIEHIFNVIIRRVEAKEQKPSDEESSAAEVKSTEDYEDDDDAELEEEEEDDEQ